MGAAEIPAAELANRKAVMIGAFGRDVETTGGLAGAAFIAGPVRPATVEAADYASDIEAVTPAQARTAAKAYFDPATASLVVVGDAKVFSARLKANCRRLQPIAIDKLNLDSATLR